MGVTMDMAPALPPSGATFCHSRRVAGRIVGSGLKIVQFISIMTRYIVVFWVSLIMVTSDAAIARNVERTVVKLQCSGPAWPDRTLMAICQQMAQSLAEVIPRAAIRLVSASDWQPYTLQDVSVRLEMSKNSGKMLWQIGPRGTLHTGPSAPFHTQDSRRASDVRRFTDRVVHSTRAMLDAARAAALK